MWINMWIMDTQRLVNMWEYLWIMWIMWILNTQLNSHCVCQKNFEYSCPHLK